MSVSLPARNADGDAVVPLTDEQRYLFDTRGWLLFPALISEEELKPMREFFMRLKDDSESLPEHERSTIGGPLLPSIDHPALVGFCNEFVAHGILSGEQSYGFRLESSAMYYRPAGFDSFRPHGGQGFLNLGGNSHVYRMERGRAFSGLTRMVWELNPVRKGFGGTKFLSGSHKAAFAMPKCAAEDRNSALWETYECPAGSLLVFTEAISHTGDLWSDEEHDRLAVFRCYNAVGSKWHEWEPHPKLVETMPPLRRSLFRSVSCQNNLIGLILAVLVGTIAQ
jgi:hypothetical protein